MFNVNTSCKAFLLMATVLLSAASVHANQPVQPEMEILHWWQTGGDRSAMDILANRFQVLGGTWFDESSDTYASTRESALTRMAKGYPPTAIQWNAGTEIQQFAALGLLNSITDNALLKEMRNRYNTTVFESVFYDDGVIALPVNIHAENWMWVNTSFFSKEEVTATSTWQQFLEKADVLKEMGTPALAIGSDNWQQRILFHTIVLGIAGADAYQTYLSASDPSVVDSAEFIDAIQTFLRLREFSDTFGNGSWTDQVNAVSQGEAATLVMGDWAKGEFINLNAEMGVDIDCTLAPETESHLQPVFDVFLLGKVNIDEELEGQRILQRMLLDQQLVTEFNRVKGSVPPFRNVDPADVDHCGKKVVSLLSSEQGILPSYASYSDGEFHNALEMVIHDIWTGRFANAEHAAAALKVVLMEESVRTKEVSSAELNQK